MKTKLTILLAILILGCSKEDIKEPEQSSKVTYTVEGYGVTGRIQINANDIAGGYDSSSLMTFPNEPMPFTYTIDKYYPDTVYLSANPDKSEMDSEVYFLVIIVDGVEVVREEYKYLPGTIKSVKYDIR